MNRYREISLTISEGKKAVTGKRMYKTVKYPDIPLLPDDIYVYAEEGAMISDSFLNFQIKSAGRYA